jgi:DNA polymerase III subunit gamma/tau
MAHSFKLISRGDGPLRDRYRPQRLSEVVPTFSMKEATAIISNPHASQVHLFEGLTGCGKTTLARIIARACLCEAEGEVEKPCLTCGACKSMERNPDFSEKNVADYRGVDNIRDNIAGMMTMPGYGKRKIYVYDEAHQFTPQSQELLCKVLEEPVGNTLIFLCTTNSKGLKRTLMARCASINFKRVSRAQMQEVVKQITEDNKVAYPSEEIFEDMFMKADGSVRDLLNLLDKYLLGTYGVGGEEGSSSGIEGSPDIFKLVGAVKSKEWPVLRKLLDSDYIKNNPDGYRETICKFLVRDALKMNEVQPEVSSALGLLAGSLANEPLAEQHSILVLRCMRVCYVKK